MPPVPLLPLLLNLKSALPLFTLRISYEPASPIHLLYPSKSPCYVLFTSCYFTRYLLPLTLSVCTPGRLIREIYHCCTGRTSLPFQVLQLFLKHVLVFKYFETIKELPCRCPFLPQNLDPVYPPQTVCRTAGIASFVETVFPTCVNTCFFSFLHMFCSG